MYRITLSIALVLACATGFAQKNFKRVQMQMWDQARTLYAAEEYEQAARLYRQLAPVDTAFSQLSHDLGVCMMNIPGMRDEASPYLERAVRQGYKEAYLQLGLLRHQQNRFGEAIALLEQYKGMVNGAIEHQEADRLIEMAQNGRVLLETPVKVRIKNLGPLVNSTAHDYCPLVTADGTTMYFTSRREGTRGGGKDVNGQFYEDIYVTRRIGDTWTKAKNAGAVLNTNSHDATVGLNPDGSSMIIYRSSNGMASGDLYEARAEVLQWQKPELMTEKINSKYHEPSASIAPGGDEIYFSSDRPGGLGGRDLYRIRRLPNGQWSEPLNLGPKVNTELDEDAPFVHSDGTTLFFSSQGHNSMGGFDIFKVVLEDPDMNGWGDPQNMGWPLNTVNNDIFFSLSADGATGYFSSEREDGLGKQDIYMIEFPDSQLDHVYVLGTVKGSDDKPLKARIMLTPPDGEEVLGIYNTNGKNGRFMMLMSKHQRGTVTVEAPGYQTREIAIKGMPDDVASKEMRFDIELEPEGERLTRTEAKP